MRQRDVIKNFDSAEMLEWMSYDMACDKDFREKTYKQIEYEEQLKETNEQQAARIINFFKGINNG